MFRATIITFEILAIKNHLFTALFLTLPFLSVPHDFAPAVTPQANHFVDEKKYNIAQLGAVGDGVTLNTKAIQKVIDDCAKNGGGTVVIPKGSFLSGAIFLKPGVNIEIQADGVLKGSTNIEDYPKLMTRIEGHFEPWRAALINGDKVDHLKITGKGTLDGSGSPFWKKFYAQREKVSGTTNLDVERPRLAFIRDSKDVLISGINFKDSGFWNLHLYRNKGVTVEDCRFEAAHRSKPDDHAPSSDGIDVDSSQDIIIRRCFFAVGDDDIALKGTKGPFAMDDKDSPPVENIRISDCIFEAGGGVVTCGSEATIVRNVRIERCEARGVSVLRLKLRPDTPQQYEDISLSDITMSGNSTLLKVTPWTQYFDLKGQTPPKSLIKNVRIENVKGTCAAFGEVKGTPTSTIEPLQLKNIDIKVAELKITPETQKNLKLTNVVVNGKKI